jgi:nitrogen regulatory protein PII
MSALALASTARVGDGEIFCAQVERGLRGAEDIGSKGVH